MNIYELVQLARTSTDPLELTELAKERNCYVLKAVAENPATPDAVREQLASRPRTMSCS